MNENVYSNDDDMKIAPENFSKHVNTKSDSEDANLFLMHQRNGNIQKAHKLGSKFSQVVIQEYDEHYFDNKNFVDIQIKSLSAFIAIQFLDDMCIDSIIANSAKSVFNKQLQKEIPDVYNYMISSATASVMLLNFLECENDKVNCGNTFANICSQKDNKDYITYGEKIYTKYYDMFYNIYKNINFIK